MREILDKIDEIEAKADKFHDEGDTHNLAYCMGQMYILNWMCKNTRMTHVRNIDSIHAGFKEEEDE